MITIKDGKIELPEGTNIPDGIYYTSDEFAAVNGLSLDVVRKWKLRNRIDFVTLYGRVLIPANAQSRARKYTKPASDSQIKQA